METAEISSLPKPPATLKNKKNLVDTWSIGVLSGKTQSERRHFHFSKVSASVPSEPTFDMTSGLLRQP